MSYFTIPELSSILTLFQYVNTLTDDFFWSGVTIAIFLIALVFQGSSSRFGEALSSAAFLATIVAVLLGSVGLVGWTVVLSFVILTALSMFLG